MQNPHETLKIPTEHVKGLRARLKEHAFNMTCQMCLRQCQTELEKHLSSRKQNVTWIVRVQAPHICYQLCYTQGSSIRQSLTHATIAIHRCHLIRNIHQQTQHNEQPAHYWRNMHGVAFTGHLLKQKHGGVMSSLSTQLHQYVSFTIIPINQVPCGNRGK